MARSIVLTTLSVFLGLYFMFVGGLKVTPFIHRDMHREARRVFVQFAKVFPFATPNGVKISPKSYRLMVGWVEVGAGAILAFVPGPLKMMANIMLLFNSLFNIHAHYASNDKFERIAPSIVFSLMLTCRIIVNWQFKLLQKQEALKEIQMKEEAKLKAEEDAERTASAASEDSSEQSTSESVDDNKKDK